MINKIKLGLSLGALFGLVHLVWSILVALDWGAPYLLFIFKLHFFSTPFTTLPFNFLSAVTLVIIASAVGYVLGYILGAIWNFVQEK